METTVKHIADFYDEYPMCIGDIEVETRFGYKTIQFADITSYDSEVIEIITSSDKKIYVSPEHRFFGRDSWINVKELKILSEMLTRDGYEKVKTISIQADEEDLYDLQVAEVHEYYSNDIVSHNSTMLDSIAFALYGKPLRKITKPQLLNSINQKELLVELEFSISKDEYLIRRGMKPNVFEIWKNNILVNQDAASKDYQQYLEENVLKLNYKSFTQIVILGSATYVPFMDLTPAIRREVIEDLLDIQIFSTMNILLKEKISASKVSIDENKHEIELVKTKIDSAKENSNSIRQLKEVEVIKIKEKIKEQLEILETEASIIETLEKDIAELLPGISDKSTIKTKIDTYKKLKSDLEYNKNLFEKELLFYHDNDNCPACKQGIDTTFKDHIVEEKEIKKLELETGLLKIKINIDKLNTKLDEISKIEDNIHKLQLEAVDHKSHIKYAKNTLVSCKKDLDYAQQEVKEVDTSKIIAYNNTLEKVQQEQILLFDARETFAVAAAMLKDTGIKTQIIKQYTPIINKLINKYLSAFELFVDFQLDENFNEVIKSRFRDTFSYASFSEGEKLRINLAVLLTWRAVAKLRNSASTNLMVLDEILDGSLDSVGVENLIDTIKTLNSDDNVFLISHRNDSFAEKFDSYIRFEKVKNFSRIADK